MDYDRTYALYKLALLCSNENRLFQPFSMPFFGILIPKKNEEIKLKGLKSTTATSVILSMRKSYTSYQDFMEFTK